MKRLIPAAVSLCLAAAVSAAGAPAATPAESGAGFEAGFGAEFQKVATLASQVQIIPGTEVAILAQGAGSPIDASSSFVSGSSQRLGRAAQDSWKRAYAGLPAQVQQAVPPELRPTPDASAIQVTVVPVQEPSPAPEPPKCVDCVAITYDDGPVPGTTPQLLDILKRKNVQATFFVVGQNVAAYPEILRRIRDEGHTIANHTYTHPDLAHQADGTISAQLDDTNAAIKNAAGVSPQWMRPPYGSYDSRTSAQAGDRGMAVAMWDVDTSDWQHRNAATTCSRAVAGAQPGSIVLMHDIHQPTVDATECVIDGLRAKGLRPVGLEELIKRPEPGHVYTNDI